MINSNKEKKLRHSTASALTCLLAVLMLQGCFYQMVDQTDILKAQEFCSKQNRGGVKEIRTDVLGAEKLTCINGDSIFGSVVKLKLAADASMTDG